MRKNVLTIALLAMTIVLVLTACGPAATTVAPATSVPPTSVPSTQVAATLPPVPTVTPAPFVFGMLLVGAKNDNGWSQATYDGGLYVEQQIAGSKMLYLENVYSGSPSYPGLTASQLADQLVSQGAKLIFFNSDDMKDEALKFANANPKIYVVGV